MAATPALEVVTASGRQYRLHQYVHDPASPFGLEAAEVLQVAPERVFKTLVVDDGDALAVAVVPVSSELDLKAMARALGLKKVAMAAPSEAERATGYVVGGISPLGQKRRLRTIVDESVASWSTVFVSAGQRGLELELTPADLVALAGASCAAVGRPNRRHR